LGTQQTIRFSPPPSTGTNIAVALTPYSGYGCVDTLYARLLDTLSIEANAGRDTVSCNHNPVVIGSNAIPGDVYSWSPAAGLNDPTVANPIATPDVTTSYVLSMRHDGGGCLDQDTVLVKASVINNAMKLIGKAVYCEGYGDSSILVVQPADSIQWFKDDLAIDNANQTQFAATKTGSYYAMLFNKEGCSLATQKQDIIIDKARPGITYPVQYAIVDLPLTLQARQFGTSAVWSPANNLDDPSSFSPAFRGASDQLYTIKIVTNTGCETVDTQLVKTVTHADIYVPTAFTPNNDGLNDLLRPTLMGMKELKHFRVYNRFGKLLFDTKTNMEGWNGDFEGSTLPTQVVVWIAEAIGVDGKVYTRKGTSTLVR
jgi:gliding motility-associated-like protein